MFKMKRDSRLVTNVFLVLLVFALVCYFIVWPITRSGSQDALNSSYLARFKFSAEFRQDAKQKL